MTIVETTRPVTAGVDTHADVHVAAVVDHLGGVLGIEAFETTEAGCQRLVDWLRCHGEINLVGVEGTGSYGAGLTRHLDRAGIARGRGRSAEPAGAAPGRQVRPGRRGRRRPCRAVGSGRWAARRAATVTSKRSACCRWPAARRRRNGSPP